MSDGGWLHLVTEDESSKFTGLYREFYPRVLAYAMRRAVPDVAREAVDETFLIAWRKWDVLPAGAVLPWLLVVARNVLADQRRRGRRQDALASEIAAASSGLTEPGSDAAVVERLTVLSALARLASSDREVLFLTVWDGLNNRDAATVAGCSTATFAVRLYRARRVNGQVAVPAGGQLKVLTPRVVQERFRVAAPFVRASRMR